jgi:hypothetical protein
VSAVHGNASASVVNPMNAEAAARAWRGWATMNHVRSALVLTALLSELVTLTRVAQMTPR